MKISYWVILCDGLFEAYLVTGLVGMPFGRLHFSKSPVDEFELDTSVFVDVVQVGEDFFDIGFVLLVPGCQGSWREKWLSVGGRLRRHA